MKYKNIFFGLCIIIIASETSAMQLIAQQVPKSRHQIHRMGLQKRDVFFGHDTVAILMIVSGIMAVNVTTETLAAAETDRWRKAITFKTLYDQVAAIGDEKCSSAYIKKIPCQNTCCCKHFNLKDCDQSTQNDAHKKIIEIFNDINNKEYFLSNLKDGLQKLDDKEEKAKQLLTQKKIYTEGYEKVIDLLEHKKDCYVKQIALFDEFYNSDEQKKQRDKEYCEKIKTITIMVTKAKNQQYSQQQHGQQECNQRRSQQQHNKIDDSYRNDDSARDLNMLMINTYVAKQIYDNAMYPSDNSSSSSNTSNTDSYSSQSYSDSSSNDSSSSSYSNNE